MDGAYGVLPLLNKAPKGVISEGSVKSDVVLRKHLRCSGVLACKFNALLLIMTVMGFVVMLAGESL